MADTSTQSREELAFAVHEQPLDGEIHYLTALVNQHSGLRHFSTGAGHIFFELMRQLPTISTYENEKTKLCHHIAGVIYPLAEHLKARGVDITLTIAPAPLLPPSHVEDMSTYAALDIRQKTLRHCFLSQRHAMPDAKEIEISSGLSVLCQPLFYHYHRTQETPADENDITPHPRNAASALPSRDWSNLNIEKFPEESETPDLKYHPKDIINQGGGAAGTAEENLDAVPEAVLNQIRLAPSLSITAARQAMSPQPQPKPTGFTKLQLKYLVPKPEPSIDS